jgi:hypothetical protein
MTIYLVADLSTNPHTQGRYWRVTGCFPSVIHATQWAGRDSIVTQWEDHNQAYLAYDNRRLPDTGYEIVNC